MRRKKEGHGHEMTEETQLVTPMEGRYPDFIIKCGHCGAKVGVARAETQEN